MCQSLEDCLVSRIGFRIFLVVVGTLLAAILTVNIHYVMFRQPVAEAQDAVSKLSIDGAISSAVVHGHVTMVSDHVSSHNRTKILIWSDDDGIFFAQLSKQIIYLRTSKGGCPMLNDCAFSSDKRKFDRADVVLVAAKNSSSLKSLVPAFNVGSKIWSLLLPDPSYHSAFMETIGDVRKFDSLTSYLPNSTFPLAQIKFESITREASFSPGPTKSTILGSVSSEKRDIHEEHKGHRHKLNHKKHHEQHEKLPEMSHRSRRESNPDRRVVATILDECETPGNREAYIEEMRKADLDVQVYGKCGAPCPGHSKADCLRHIDNHFKFYLAFDSHICQHYLSPDLWQLLSVTTKLVPVVFGGVNYVEVLPHDAYIDALNQSPSVLAKTLIYLSKNKEEFSGYLAWRTRYTLAVNEWPCYLCKALTDKVSRKSSNNEGSVQLAQEGLCTSWPHLNFAENLSES